MSNTISLKNFDYANLTDKGLQREQNEDFLAYFDTCNGHVFVLCDGMGGHNAGEYASELAVETVGNFLNKKYIKNPFDAVENAIKSANKEVYKKSKEDSRFSGMGTTITLALIRDNRVYYGHVGDSRIYHFSQNKLKQITKDHSFVQSLIDKGIISKDEAKDHPRKNEISKALGLSSFIEPSVAPAALIPQNDDFILICSDGLTNMLKNKKIEDEIKNNNSIIDTANKLIKLSNKKGGIDNISVQLIKFFNLSFNENKKKSKSLELRKILNLNKTLIITSLFFILIIFSVFFILQNKETQKKNSDNTIKKPMKTNNKIFAYKFNKNETYNSIAEKFNIEIPILKKLNPNIKTIKNGKHLKIIIRDLYIVTSEDDLGIILKKFNLTSVDLMKANDLYKIEVNVGQELIIPCYKKKENDYNN